MTIEEKIFIANKFKSYSFVPGARTQSQTWFDWNVSTIGKNLILPVLSLEPTRASSFSYSIHSSINHSSELFSVKKESKSSFVFIFLFPLPSYPPLFDFAIRGKVQFLISSSERFLKSSILIHFGQGIFNLSINFF